MKPLDLSRFDYVGTIAGVACNGVELSSISINPFGVIHEKHTIRRGVYVSGRHGEGDEPKSQGLPQDPLMHDDRAIIITSIQDYRRTEKALGLNPDSIKAGGMYEQILLDFELTLWKLQIGTTLSIYDPQEQQVCQLMISRHNYPCAGTASHLMKMVGCEGPGGEFLDAWKTKAGQWRGVCAYISYPCTNKGRAVIMPGYRFGVQLPEQHSTLAENERHAIMVALRQNRERVVRKSLGGDEVTMELTAKQLDIRIHELETLMQRYCLPLT